MRQRTADSLTALIAGLLAFVCFYLLIEEAGATSYKNPQAEAKAEAEATAAAAADASAQAESTQSQSATASNDGVTVTEESHVENNSSNVVLVPNNNSESCVRVFGLAFGKNGESGAIGFPWRSASCDFSQAASAADAQGNLELGWYWRCHMKNIYKTFKDQGDTDDTAIRKCHERMIEPGRKDAIIEELTRKLEIAIDEGARERDRLNKSLVDERQKCKDRTDRAVKDCYK